jgi:hypothetical protein
MVVKIMQNNSDNIDFLIMEENSNHDNSNQDNFDVNEFLKDFEKTTKTYNEDMFFPQLINYSINYTVKDLMLICDYYGIAKDLKSSKCKKETIVNILVDFESNPLNTDIVFRRQNMWFYINELKNDKFMKKFVLW